jgi:hypothetical protein
MGSREEKALNSPRLSCGSSHSSARPESRASSIDSDAAIRKKKKINESDLPLGYSKSIAQS